ncbi:hypothetical protein FG386_002483 [Cryptosporidium ryanae]|uniref:uncharacterized protein n=1 Tax=Cryptosporidium ryanae TaxID=515981 RepID=UPI00351A6A56|nr:hypothetical protein FG386_002483 [Cryptosporidium ryanae]
MANELESECLRSSLKFVLQDRVTKDDFYSKKVFELSRKIQSAMILNMKIFRNERLKDLDESYKLSKEEMIENSVLRIVKGVKSLKKVSFDKYGDVELWRIQKRNSKYEEMKDLGNFNRNNNSRREGVVTGMRKLIKFDRDKYNEQMTALSRNPAEFEKLRTSHVPAEEDKNALIKEYLRHQRRKPLFDSLDNHDGDVYHISRENKKYNTKLDRAFGEYTEEIKQNLERGTAI